MNLTKKKITQLQVIRALGFLGVLTCHCGIRDFGQWAVSIFFVLSGFLMTYTYWDEAPCPTITNSFIFSIRKIKKLYLLHIITLLFAILFRLINNNDSLLTVMLDKSTWLNITLLQAWIPINTFYFSLNGVAWYLSACVLLYFSFPFIINYIKNNSFRRILLTLILVYSAQTILGYFAAHISFFEDTFEHFTRWVTYICPLYRCGDFYIGCVTGYIFINKHVKLKTGQSTVIEIFALLAILFSEYIYESQRSFLGKEAFRYTILFTPSSVLLIYIFALGSGYISKLLTKKPLIFIGNISGYAFLIHMVVLKFIKLIYRNIYSTEINKYLLFIITFTITVILSVAYLHADSFIRRSLRTKNK